MNTDEYYQKEPEEHFAPLPDEMYRRLYDLEMKGVRADIPYYLSKLTGRRSVLELGCGSGRLTRALFNAGHKVTAADLSSAMLKAARKKENRIQYLCMDMRVFALSGRTFDGVLVGYNTLNLLAGKETVARCLHQCRMVCRSSALLLLQIFTPTEDLLQLAPHETSFQFQVFDRPEGGKVVKETLRRYDCSKQIITMTDRYRIRPMTPDEANLNYQQVTELYVPPAETWVQLLSKNGFRVISMTDRYDRKRTAGKGVVLIQAEAI